MGRETDTRTRVSAVAVKVEETLNEVLEEHRWMSLLQEMHQAEVSCGETRWKLLTSIIKLQQSKESEAVTM